MNFSPLEANKPSVFAWFSNNLSSWGDSSRQVRMLGALVPCSPSKHIFCCTLLTLWCACVNECHTLHKTRVEPCSVVPWQPPTAYGRYLLGVYTDLPTPRGTHGSFGGPTRNGQSVWTEPSFLVKLFGLFDHFRTS